MESYKKFVDQESLQTTEFAQSTNEILLQYAQIMQNIATQLLGVTNKGVILKEKFSRNPSPEEMLELKQIV